MGCGESKPKKQVDPDAVDRHGMTLRMRRQMQEVKAQRVAGNYMMDSLPDPLMTDKEPIGPESIPQRTKEQIFENLKTSVPSVFITVSAEVNLNVLFVYPDQNWNQFPPTNLTRRKIFAAESGADESTIEPPKWQCLRCQFKEFTKIEHQYNRWYERADTSVPGLRMIDVAGPTACWATMSPGSYQQRWCLPDGRRAVSLLDTGKGIPTRLWDAYKAKGCDEDPKAAEKFCRDFLECCSNGLKLKTYVDQKVAETGEAPSIEMLEEFGNTEEFKSLDGFDSKIDEYLPIFMDQFDEDEMGTWCTIWEFNPEIKAVMDYLSLIEDSILRNWFEIAVEAELDVDMWYFKRKDAKEKPDNMGGLKNWARKKVLDGASDSCADLISEFKKKIHRSTNLMMQTAFGGPMAEKSQKMVDRLFPDLKAWSALQARSIHSELVGVQSRVEGAEKMKTPEVEAKLKEWRRLEERPLEERRLELYKNVEKMIQAAKAAGGRGADTSEDAIPYLDISIGCRKPFRVERYFFKFRFICMFPLQTDAEGKMPVGKRPKVCNLVLWPEKHSTLKKVIPMEAFELPNGGKDQVEKAADKAMKNMVNGETEIGKDEKKDPRVNWIDYENGNFRGFSVLEEVAIDMPYAFNFEMDGCTFLGAHQPIEKDDDEKECYYRRVCFFAKTRPYTLNPLKIIGAVL